MKRHRFSRRAALRALGASPMLLPLLEADRAWSQDAPVKRLVCVNMVNGTMTDDFFGFHSGGSQTLSALEPWRDRVTTVQGLGIQTMMDQGGQWDGHSSFPALLTGSYSPNGFRAQAKNASVDQVVSDHIAQSTPLTAPLLNLGVRSERDGQPTSWRAAGEPNPNETESSRLFDRLFGSPALPQDTLDDLAARRASVLDFLGRDLEAFATRMGTEDRAKIQAHLQSIRNLENSVQQSMNGGGDVGGEMAACPSPDVDLSDAVPARMHAMFNMMATALLCDVTRTITIDLYDNGGGNGNTFPWLNVQRDYHEMAHAGNAARADKLVVDQWLFEQVAILVSQLANVQEGDVSALDNSLILVSNDMETGDSHFVGRINYLYIGSAAGYLKTGQHIDLRGGAHNLLLTTVANAMGVPIDSMGENYAGSLSELLA